MSGGNCCSDCWEWFVQFLMSQESGGREDWYQPEKEDKDVGGDEVVHKESDHLPLPVEVPDVEQLTRPEEPFRPERMRQLFNRHGFNLGVFPGGHVRGVREAFSANAVLEVLPVSVGVVQIRGVETGLFLAMGPEGNLYARRSARHRDTVFVEDKSGPYLTYLRYSHKHIVVVTFDVK